MAILNGMYIFVETEDVTRGLEVSSHAVESGIDITDNIKKQPIVISLSGEIVGADAPATLNAIIQLHQGGKLVSYSGRNVITEAMITKFDTGHPNTIYGGCSFSMEITEIRIAKSAYVDPNAPVSKPVTKSGTQQITKKEYKRSIYYRVKAGDTLWSIAKSYYGDGAHYLIIYEYNKETIDSSGILHEGQKISIPVIE